jgi:hypothetical protein
MSKKNKRRPKKKVADFLQVWLTLFWMFVECSDLLLKLLEGLVKSVH